MNDYASAMKSEFVLCKKKDCDDMSQIRVDKCFLKKNGDLAIKTRSERYVIRRGEKVVAQDVAASLYFENE